MLVIIGSVRIIYRVLQCRYHRLLLSRKNIIIMIYHDNHDPMKTFLHSRSSRLRYHLINMRMNRYFKKSSKVAKIETFVCKCKLGDW